MVRFLFLYNIRQQKKIYLSAISKKPKNKQITQKISLIETIHLHIRKKSSNFAADITYIYINKV